MSDIIKSVQLPNIVTGRLRIDPDGKDATEFGVYSTGIKQVYELGTRYRQDDRVFRYGKAASAITPNQGAFDVGTFFARNTTAAAIVGQNYVQITTDATSGDLTNGFGVKNNMVGGYYVQPGAVKTFRRITGHVAAPDGTVVKVYLDGPLQLALVTNSYSEWCPNPYLQLTQPGGTNTAVMGVATVAIVSGSFGWFQTWGPTWMQPNAILDFGAAYDQMARFHEGGNLEDANNHANSQIAGFIMGRRTIGNWANPPFIYLTISP
jgi:hypothetical protein